MRTLNTISKKRLSRVFVGKALIGAVVAATLWAAGGISQAAFTNEDVEKARGNDAAARKIFEDKSTPLYIRQYALEVALTYNLAGTIEYLDTPFMDEDPKFGAAILRHMAYNDSDKWDDATHYPKAVKLIFEVSRSNELYWSQRMHVRALLKAGKAAEALSESKRLFAVTPLDPRWLSDAVQVIAAAIRAEALAKGQSLKQAIAAQNAYLEGIKKGDVSQTAFAAAPFPAANEVAAAYENKANVGVAMDAFLFNGDFDKAQEKADVFMALAADEGQLWTAIVVAGRVANAKAGVPTAANALLQ